MANKAGRNVQEFEENWKFFERFIHDILVYTLTKCGLPESSLPTTDGTENIYRRTDFLKIAGASVLRISLVMRDEWKQMFKSRFNSSGFNYKDIVIFAVKLARCYLSSRTCLSRSLVEILLASYNEIMLYFHFENIDIDFDDFITLSSGHIVYVTGLNRKNPEKLEELFDSFDDISGYTEWITDFIGRFAIPYGSRDDVSNRFEDASREFTDGFRFLRSDRSSAIADGRSENLAKLTSIQSGGQSPEPPNVPQNPRLEQDLEKMSLDVKETSQETQSAKTKRKKSRKRKRIGKKKGLKNLDESTSLLNDGQSPEPPNLPMATEIGALGELKFLGSGSTRTENISEHLSQNDISKLKQRVAAEGSKSSVKISSISNDSESMEPQKLPTGSEINAERINKSLGSLSTCSENVSGHLPENNKSCDISSEVDIQQDLGKTSLDVEGASPEIHVPKAKYKIIQKEKDIDNIKEILVISSLIGYALLVMCFKIYTSK